MSEFSTEDVIIRILAAERGKLASRGNGREDLVNGNGKKSRHAELMSMMPPHRLWLRPGKGRRPEQADHGIKKWTRRKKLDSACVYRTIRKYWDSPEEPWVGNLHAFVSEIQGIIDGRIPFTMETPSVSAKFKKQDRQSGECIFRPICSYSDLRTKVVLTLCYRYLLASFDCCFHGGMMFMRGPRQGADGKWSPPNFLDCVKLASAYRRKHDSEKIYVGECDIKKFYDIFNHDVVLECLDRLISIRCGMSGTDPRVFSRMRELIVMYLDSYDFPHQVLALNDAPEFWKGERKKHSTKEFPEPVCRFDWVSREEFISSGCYASGEELDRAIEDRKIGVPQGGPLSGMLVNVVMQTVDRDIIGERDPGRFFVRFCDDILLMHTDKEKCAEYLDTYRRNLTAQKLVYHKFCIVGEGTANGRLTPRFWDAKSKEVFLWGRGEEDSSDWIAFVGYELRRTGEIRIRKDKIDLEFKNISRTYHRAVKAGKEHAEENLRRFGMLPGKLLDFELATGDTYTRNQGARLDKYLRLKSRQAARKLKTPVPEGLPSYAETLAGKH